MSQLVLVTPEGLIMREKKPPQVEVKDVEEPLHVKAAREAAMQSTPIKETK
jgi:hypothetical protein